MSWEFSGTRCNVWSFLLHLFLDPPLRFVLRSTTNRWKMKHPPTNPGESPTVICKAATKIKSILLEFEEQPVNLMLFSECLFLMIMDPPSGRQKLQPVTFVCIYHWHEKKMSDAILFPPSHLDKATGHTARTHTHPIGSGTQLSIYAPFIESNN